MPVRHVYCIFVTMNSFRLLVFFLAMISQSCQGQNKKSTLADTGLRMGFWNLENLFDTIQNQNGDEDFTPYGSNQWNTERYNNKLANLSRVIGAVQPDILGVCEVENAAVLSDLVKKPIAGKSYGVVHYNSPDERGIDVALLYDKAKVEIIHSDTFHVNLPNKNDRTRNILQVYCKIKSGNDTIICFVNHWPSRREGEEQSEPNRIAAANTLKTIVDSHLKQNKNIFITGNFNDNPWDTSIKSVLEAKRAFQSTSGLHNLSALLNTNEYGTLKHAGKWFLFDQLIVSSSIMNGGNGLRYKIQSTSTFKPEWMQQHGDKYEGYPLRTFGGKKYLNGYSDHFPVYFDVKYVR